MINTLDTPAVKQTVEIHDAWRMVRKIPPKDVWRTLQHLDFLWLYRLVMHPDGHDTMDVVFECPALRIGLNRTNISTIFNQFGVLEVSRQHRSNFAGLIINLIRPQISIDLFKEAVETARRLTGSHDLTGVTVSEFYGYNSAPSHRGIQSGTPTSASKGFWKAIHTKKKKLWSSFPGTTAAGSEQHIEEVFHRATCRDNGFRTILRGPEDSMGPFPGGVSIIL